MRQNQLTSVDDSVQLAPHLRTLLLGFNQITGLDNLGDLNELCTLELTANHLGDIHDIHLKLGAHVSRYGHYKVSK